MVLTLRVYIEYKVDVIMNTKAEEKEPEEKSVLDRLGYTSLFVPEQNFDPYVILIKLRLGLKLYMSKDLADALMQFMKVSQIPRYDYSFKFTSRSDFIKVTRKDV